jgi:hypothetical protein
MSAPAAGSRSHRPQLRLVQSSLRPLGALDPRAEWRRVAAAILAITWEVSRHLRDQRFSRVNEDLDERREMLGLMRAMPLDAEGRACLRSLEAAALESERGIAAMTAKSR